MTTPLSRHLYRLDEVKACLRYAVLKRCRLEAVFWAMELIDSLEGWTVLEILLESWLLSAPACWTFGHHLLDLMEKDELEPSDILAATHAAAGLVERDASVFWLLSRGAEPWTTQPDFVGAVPLPQAYEKSPPDVQCFVRALLQGKGLLAWTLVRHSWGPEIWTILRNCATQKGVREEVQSVLRRLECLESNVWEARAAAVYLVANSHLVSRRKQATPLRLEMGAEIKPKVEEWTALEGRRKRREFRVRTEALGPGCARAALRNTEDNLQELREPLAALKGSPYWETVAEEMGGWKTVRKSDDHKEAFYDLYFPDDIPDEWSTADQEKSHGRGILIGSLTATGLHMKHLRSLFSGTPSGGLEAFTKKALSVEREPIPWSDVYENPETRATWKEVLSSWRLGPMRKKILLIQ